VSGATRPAPALGDVLAVATVLRPAAGVYLLAALVLAGDADEPGEEIDRP
jgi:hypothetical protein